MAKISGSTDDLNIPYFETEEFIYLQYPAECDPEDEIILGSLQKLNPNIVEYDGYYCHRQLIKNFSIRDIYEYALLFNQIEQFADVGIMNLTPRQLDLL